jgi:hypothetical protein
VAREHTEIPDHVKPGRRNGSAKPNQQVVGLEHKRPCPILPLVLQCELEAPVFAPVQPLLGQRWPHHIATEPLELLPIAPVDPLLGIQIDPEGFGDGLEPLLAVTCGVVGLGLAPRDQTQQRLPCSVP